MIKRVRVTNFRCFSDFELKPASGEVLMLLGLNGVGKSTLLSALSILQRIGGGVSNVESLVSMPDFAFGETNKPMRFEIEAIEGGRSYVYGLALELPPKFKKLRVLSEQLSCNGELVFGRERAQVSLGGGGCGQRFMFDWHQIALPVIQSEHDGDPVDDFRRFLRRMVLVSPMPSVMIASPTGGNLPLDTRASNFVDWLIDIQLTHLEAYAKIVQRLKDFIFPDLASYALSRSEEDGERRLEFVFDQGNGRIVKTSFDRLSDGEKCEVLAAVVIVLTEMKECSFCYWDEPDNYLAISEVRSLVTDMRVAFHDAGVQLMMSSHNLQALDAVPLEKVKVFLRDSHLESSRLCDLTDILSSPESRKHLDLRLLTGSLYDEAR